MKNLEYETFKTKDENDLYSKKANYKKLIAVVNKWFQKNQNATIINIEMQYEEFIPRIHGTEFIAKVIYMIEK